ncbi:hypothetical protein IVB12_15820 [Bradyrhizobium sp. 179]|uniref:hypothetical protein n=1 Tax=Bradyrhizobium sp. 179 TaxID=2782648 RepID=UPI001FF8A63D|nr:hypothetical protein [Bradyrhizobium sp. 179]MCK1543384.1 hypothetical protein [Bradyrhizobium sp. 179]
MDKLLTETSHRTLIQLNNLARLRRHDLELRGPPNSTFSYTEETKGRIAVKRVTTDENGLAIIPGEPY